MEYMTVKGLVELFQRNNVKLDRNDAKLMLEVLCNEGVYTNQYQYSDNILSEALKNSGYKTTEKNISILRDNLKMGNKLIDITVDNDYYNNILKENQYQTTEKNINILVEGINSGNEDVIKMAGSTVKTKYIIAK